MGRYDQTHISIKSLSQNHKRLIITGNEDSVQQDVVRQINLSKYSEEYIQNTFEFHKIGYQNLNILRITLQNQWKVQQYPEGFFDKKDGIIYVLDSDDMDSINQAVYTINQILSANFDAQIPVLVLLAAQNIDHANNSLIISEFKENLNDRVREFNFQKCSQTTGEGIYEAFEWLSEACQKYSF